jgi:hypothetical protein
MINKILPILIILSAGLLAVSLILNSVRLKKISQPIVLLAPPATTDFSSVSRQTETSASPTPPALPVASSSANSQQQPRQQNDFLKSVRLDLSAIAIPSDLDKLQKDILNKLTQAGANAIFVSPWSDGRANYQSALAPLNRLGKNNFLIKFLKEAHQRNIKVYAWFVVGKDNFPFFLHPEWFAKTIKGADYYQADEPGINLPFASLANDDYLNYHLKLIREVNSFNIDGWVISEPVIGWGDRYDNDYTDFSSSARNKFKALANIDPRQIFNSRSQYYYEKNKSLYEKWVNFRAQIVTNFVAQTVSTIKQKPSRTIILTLFTEPDKNGRLTSFSKLKEWLGEDIVALTKLDIDYLEIQDLFLDFPHKQTPEWTKSMITQFRAQLPSSFPLLVSVQGYGQIPAHDFAAAIKTAMAANIAGVSFYAFHTLTPTHWQALANLWQ